MGSNFAARSKRAKLVTKNILLISKKKSYFDEKLTNSNGKVTSNKTRHAVVEGKIK